MTTVEAEPLDAGHDAVPAELLELFEVLEFQRLSEERHPLGRHLMAAAVVPFVRRSEWGARPATTSTNITPRELACHYEGPHMGTFDHTSCPTKVRGIQAYHMDHNGWADIAYSEVVCPHGTVYEGRGPGHRTAANGSNDGNQFAYAVCFLGGQGDLFTEEAKNGFWSAARMLGVDGRTWYPHNHYFNTSCPGDQIFAWLGAGHPEGNSPVPAPPSPPQPPTPAPPAPHNPDLTEKLMQAPVLSVNSPDRHHVGIMQSLLTWHAGDLVGDKNKFVDGDFGPHTAEVLTTWQRRTGVLKPDGVCGPATWAWLCGV